MEAPLLADGLCIRPFADQDVAEFVTAVRESVATVGAWDAVVRRRLFI
jgi:hypothetical protein